MRCEFSVLAEDTSGEAGHYKDLTETGNRARKGSGTQGTETLSTLLLSFFFLLQRLSYEFLLNFTGNLPYLTHHLTFLVCLAFIQKDGGSRESRH